MGIWTDGDKDDVDDDARTPGGVTRNVGVSRDDLLQSLRNPLFKVLWSSSAVAEFLGLDA